MNKNILLVIIVNMYLGTTIATEIPNFRTDSDKSIFSLADLAAATYYLFNTSDFNFISEGSLKVGDTIITGKKNNPVFFTVCGENIAKKDSHSETVASTIVKPGTVILVSTLYSGYTTPLSEKKSIRIR